MKKLILLILLLTTSLASQLSAHSSGLVNFESNPDFKINEIRKRYQKNDQPSSILFQDFFSQQWRFPVQAPSRFYLNQGYNGQFSHQNKNALDLSTSNGVVAATRAGTVGIVNFGGKWDQWCNSYNDCLNKGGIWNGNHIVINHPDGTSSFYIHLKPNSLMPSIFPGRQVDIGTPLGIIGGTGFTCNLSCTAPFDHLHFQVNLGQNTIPTPFEDCSAGNNNCVGGIPQQGNEYLSINYPPTNQISTGPLYLFGQRKSINSSLRVSSSPTDWFFSPTGELQVNNLCLSDNNGLRLENCDDSGRQRWTIDSNNSIRNSSTDRCLDRANDNINSSIFVSICSGSLTQQFRHISQPILLNIFDNKTNKSNHNHPHDHN